MRKPFLCALTVLAVLAGCKGSSYGDYETINASDVDEEADLTKIAYDFRIHRLEYDGPMDGIGGIKCWDDGQVMLARTNDDRKILRFDNYKVTAILDRLGRGPGEYYFIEDFTWDKVNNCIYIENDSNLVTYDATTMEFKGKQGVNFNLQNCLNVGDKMLYFGFFLEESGFINTEGDSVIIPYESMVLVDRDERDLHKGVVLYRENGLQRVLMGYPELFFVNPKNYSTCLTGPVNRIVTFSDLEKTTEVYSFKLGPVDIPVELEDVLNSNKVSYQDYENAIMSYAMGRAETFNMSNVFNIMVDGGTISFRVTYRDPKEIFGPKSNYLYFVRSNNKTKVYKHLRIPGLAMDVDPTGANGNHQVALIENLGDLAIDDSEPLSDLAEEILAELKKQNDDNPVLLEFRFK